MSGKIYGKDKLIYSIPRNIPPRLNEILTCLGLNIVLRGILAVLATLGSPDFP